MKRLKYIPICIIACALFFSNCDTKKESGNDALLFLMLAPHGTISFKAAGQPVSMSSSDGFTGSSWMYSAIFVIDLNNFLAINTLMKKK